VEIVGRGFNEVVLSLLRKRPEVAIAEMRNDRLVIELKIEVDIAPLVRLVVEGGVEVEEVCKGKASLEEVFLTLMEEEEKW